MLLNVKSVTKQPRKTQKGAEYWGIQHDDGNWYNLMTAQKPRQGDAFDCDVQETNNNGRVNRWARINSQQSKGGGGAGGNAGGPKTPWVDVDHVIRAAHAIALALEPDLQNGLSFDRSSARAAIVNTLIIGVTSGRIAITAGPGGAVEGQGQPGPDDCPF